MAGRSRRSLTRVRMWCTEDRDKDIIKGRLPAVRLDKPAIVQGMAGCGGKIPLATKTGCTRRIASGPLRRMSAMAAGPLPVTGAMIVSSGCSYIEKYTRLWEKQGCNQGLRDEATRWGDAEPG